MGSVCTTNVDRPARNGRDTLLTSPSLTARKKSVFDSIVPVVD
jgi:hypothetical protein